MKFNIQKADVEQIKAQFPITGPVPGWFFRMEEISNNVYRVEGTDLFGRTVSRDGIGPASLLEKCFKDAEKIQCQSK